MKSCKQFLLFFAVQFLNYGLLCWNYRAIAQARYGNIFASDLCCAAITFSLIKKVAKTESKAAWIGYVLGGAFGSIASVWITKHLYGV